MHIRLIRSLQSLAALLVALLVIAMSSSCGKASSATAAKLAPELPALPASAWLNSKPLRLADLRGRPVLVEFWTFECSNCRNTLAWIKDMHGRYGARGLVIIGVHTPEFPRERNHDEVARAVAELGIHYPVLIDDDYRYWKALDNSYWPAFYLIDGAGRIVATRIGELHRGQKHADSFEEDIAKAAGVRPSS